MKIICVSFFCGVLLLACVSVDVQKSVKTPRGSGKPPPETGTSVITVPLDPEPVIIEKPVYVPQSGQGAAPVKGRAAVAEAARQGTAQPQDFSAAAMLYDYHRDFVYEVYCQPVRVTDIILKPGEKVVEAPFISDSERWMIGGGISYEGNAAVQHIYVQPTQANIQASLIINTNERVYHLILRSYQDIHMPMVRWRYHQSAMPQNYITGEAAAVFMIEEGDTTISADPRFLSFNYKITYGLFKKPRWLPALVYDDGKKTYITFPDTVLQTELPAVFENRSDVLNYRVARNVMIIDKLIEGITVTIGERRVVIEKKRGKS
jgi:type IV secretion system protein VirB9